MLRKVKKTKLKLRITTYIKKAHKPTISKEEEDAILRKLCNDYGTYYPSVKKLIEKESH